MSDSSVPVINRKVGNVKWFNNKAGYGFITVGENTDSPMDVFAHYSNINVSNSQYKYLVQGEYVEFVLTPTPEGPHEFQATAITGIEGGPTLCERRRLNRDSLPEEGEEAPVRRQPRTDDRPRTARPSAKATVVRRKPSSSEKVSQDVDEEGFKRVARRKSQK